jgi:hypothetical protein
VVSALELPHIHPLSSFSTPGTPSFPFSSRYGMKLLFPKVMKRITALFVRIRPQAGKRLLLTAMACVALPLLLGFGIVGTGGGGGLGSLGETHSSTCSTRSGGTGANGSAGGSGGKGGGGGAGGSGGPSICILYKGGSMTTSALTFRTGSTGQGGIGGQGILIAPSGPSGTAATIMISN